jgi:hypothetical protein
MDFDIELDLASFFVLRDANLLTLLGRAAFYLLFRVIESIHCGQLGRRQAPVFSP